MIIIIAQRSEETRKKQMLLLNEDRMNRAVRWVCERARTLPQMKTWSYSLDMWCCWFIFYYFFFSHCYYASIVEWVRSEVRTSAHAHAFHVFLFMLCVFVYCNFFSLFRMRVCVCVFVYLPFSSLFSVFSPSLSASFCCVYVWIYVYASFFSLCVYYYISCVKLLISSLVRTTSRNGAVCLDFLVFEFECWRCRHRHYHQRYRHLKTEHIEIKIHFLANKIY